MTLDPLFLLGFILSGDFEDPDFYLLTTTSNGDVPLMHHGQIILFRRREHVPEALRWVLPADTPDLPSIPEKRHVVYDIARTFDLIANEDHDPGAHIVDTINILLDMVKAVGVPVPSVYRRDLHEVADHLTFSKDIGALFKGEERLERTDIIEALQWTLGAMMCRSMFVPRETAVSAQPPPPEVSR